MGAGEVSTLPLSTWVGFVVGPSNISLAAGSSTTATVAAAAQASAAVSVNAAAFISSTGHIRTARQQEQHRLRSASIACFSAAHSLTLSRSRWPLRLFVGLLFLPAAHFGSGFSLARSLAGVAGVGVCGFARPVWNCLRLAGEVSRAHSPLFPSLSGSPKRELGREERRGKGKWHKKGKITTHNPNLCFLSLVLMGKDIHICGSQSHMADAREAGEERERS